MRALRALGLGGLGEVWARVWTIRADRERARERQFYG
jgi:hypothetical protein